MALAIMVAFGSSGASDDRSKGNGRNYYYYCYYL